MSNNSNNDSKLVFSYMELRVAIGALGIALPLVTSIGAWLIFQEGLQRSISNYYHTGMRDVFVGALFAIGFFLLSYRGHEPADNRAGNLAFIFALGVALFPTIKDPNTTIFTTTEILHMVFTILFFSTLTYFCLCLFVKSDQEPPLPPKKQRRNLVYKISGWVMVACIVLIATHAIPAVKEWWPIPKPVFWFEALAIWAFGWSWFVKGEAILKDED